jgi:hypothetical protein
VGKDEGKDVSTSEGAGRRTAPDAGTLVLVFSGVVTAIGGSYAGTHSVAVTLMAGCAGVAITALTVWRKG